MKLANKKKQNKEKFYKMNLDERLMYLQEKTNLSANDIALLRNPSSLTFVNANRMIENAIGVLSLPLGIATNFVINNKKYVVPMAIEEPSVIAAASKAAKIANVNGGFKVECRKALMIGQVQLVSLPVSLATARRRISAHKSEILRIANSKSTSIKAKNLQIKDVVDTSPLKMGKMLVLELLVDTKDAMGANTINTMCESVSSRIEELTGGRAILRILSNYATRRMVKCRAIFSKSDIGGIDVVENILYAYSFAYSDVYRAVTHNKGIMNGIDAVALATGQDFRAIEAAAHAYAARDGKYRSLSNWYKTRTGDLVGELELPLAVGIVGGSASVHPTAMVGLKILGVKTAKELATILCAVGLAQNMAALRALAAEGIQRGHMKLHAKNIAIMAGAQNSEIDIVAEKIYDENDVTPRRAKEILFSIRHKG
jgi:hydroxymethylglutaryl-CoA reductase